VSMFEPIGGSAPKYTGMGVINPLAAICAASMMLEILGEQESADAIERAVKHVTANKLKSMEAKRMGFSTGEVGDMVAQHVADQ
jgi:3-isopropylmalate dehydrogenase